MERVAGAGVLVVEDGQATFLEHLRVASLSIGTYSVPAGGTDHQGPHSEDEVYVVTRGRATLWTPAGEIPVASGDVVFVPAREPHRFDNVTEDLCVVVVFAPAEHTGTDNSHDDQAMGRKNAAEQIREDESAGSA